MAPRFIAKQLSRPSGFMGAVIRLMMNRHNARMNAFAVRQLELEPADRVLEIGFGGGVTLPALLNSAAFVAGGVSSSTSRPGGRTFATAMSKRCHLTMRHLIRFARSTPFISGLH